MAQGNYLQNTTEWYQSRLFHFTSSELYKLMTKPRSKSAEVSDTTRRYIFDKVAEYITNGVCLDYKEVHNTAIEWGNSFEAVARRRYEQCTGQVVALASFIEYSNYFGGSPDGLVGSDGIIEIKCPYDSAVHAQYLMFETAEDLRKERPEYYAQMQGNLLVTGRQWCDFVSFDPRVQTDALQIAILRIPRNEEFIDEAIEAINTATRITNKIKERLLQRL